MSDEHYLVLCSSCGKIIEQCRCKGPKTIIHTRCEECGGPTVGSEPIPSEDPAYNYEETPNYAYRHTMPFGYDGQRVAFGGFTAKELAITGGISYFITRWLGASVPGAIVMGVGNMLWEAGSSNIAPGWKRYILGLFRKPHDETPVRAAIAGSVDDDDGY